MLAFDWLTMILLGSWCDIAANFGTNWLWDEALREWLLRQLLHLLLLLLQLNIRMRHFKAIRWASSLLSLIFNLTKIIFRNINFLNRLHCMLLLRCRTFLTSLVRLLIDWIFMNKWNRTSSLRSSLIKWGYLILTRSRWEIFILHANTLFLMRWLNKDLTLNISTNNSRLEMKLQTWLCVVWEWWWLVLLNYRSRGCCDWLITNTTGCGIGVNWEVVHWQI